MKERPLVSQLAADDESPARRYRRLFVGEPSLGALIRYELVTGTLGSLPGAAGFLLRGRAYPRLFARVGRGTVFGRGLTIRSPGRISLGRAVMIDDQCVLDAKGEGSAIDLGSQILLGRNSILTCTDATITMGDTISIGPFCFFASKSHIRIGSNVSIGSGTHVMAGGHAHDDPDTPIILQERVHKGIVIEDGVWLGSGCKILDGVTIGHDSIIGAGAVVNKDIPPWSVAIGIPARVVEKRKKMELE